MARILVIDDLEDITDLVEILLMEEGHQVVTKNCAKSISEMPAHEEFDIVITDIFMPEKDGLQIIKEMRTANAAGNHCPAIIAMSGGQQNIVKQSMLEETQALSDAYLQKPFTKETLLEAVNTVLAA